MNDWINESEIIAQEEQGQLKLDRIDFMLVCEFFNEKFESTVFADEIFNSYHPSPKLGNTPAINICNGSGLNICVPQTHMLRP